MAAHFPPFTNPRQEPTGAYRAQPELDEVEAQLRTAKASLRNAMECVDTALAEHIHTRSKRLVAEMTAEAQDRGEYDQRVHTAGASTQHGRPRKLYDNLPPNLAAAVSAPNCDGNNGSRIATPAEIDAIRPYLTAEELRGFGIGDVEPRHPMSAEADRLIGPEDVL